MAWTHTNVESVKRSLMSSLTTSVTCWFTQTSNHSRVKCVISASEKRKLSTHTWEHIQEKNLSCRSFSMVWYILPLLFYDKEIEVLVKNSLLALFRRFSCRTCGQGFAQVSSLVSHEDIHSGYKGFQCQYCGKAFRQRSALRVHEKRHTNNRSYHCSHCKESFVTLRKLFNHLAFVH